MKAPWNPIPSLSWWRAAITKYRLSVSLVIGSFIDFRACRHARGDLLFENNCSIRGFIQAPAGYLRHYYCPIRIPRQRGVTLSLDEGRTGRIGVSAVQQLIFKWEHRNGSLHLWVNGRWNRPGELDKVTTYCLYCTASFPKGGQNRVPK